MGVLKVLVLLFQCHWRLIKFLPEKIDQLNLDRVLLDIHNVMKSFPRSKHSHLKSDMPQRTIKTLLHSLCRLVGPRVSLTYLFKIWLSCACVDLLKAMLICFFKLADFEPFDFDWGQKSIWIGEPSEEGDQRQRWCSFGMSAYLPWSAHRLSNCFWKSILISSLNDPPHHLSSQNQKKSRTNETLDEIFKKIVSTENSKEVTFFFFLCVFGGGQIPI